jgi:hypothetical protein
VNLTRYVGNVPTSYVDPSGLDEEAALRAIERAVGPLGGTGASFDSKQLVDNVSASAIDSVCDGYMGRVTMNQGKAALGAVRRIMHQRGVIFANDAQVRDTIRWMKQVKAQSAQAGLPSGDVLLPGTWIDKTFYVHSHRQGFGVIDNARLAHPWEEALTYRGSGLPRKPFYINDQNSIRFDLKPAERRALQALWASPDSGESFVSTFQTVLDMAGVVPVAGEVADLTNAIIYAYNGQWFDCATSLVSVVPGVGDVLGKSAKVVVHAGVPMVVGAKADKLNGILRGLSDVAPKSVDPAASRVKLRKGTRDAIEAQQPRNATGQMVDPHTGQPLKPAEIDVGHKPGQEWRKRQQMHRDRGSTRQDVLDMENDPDIYHLEDRSSNRSHRYEQD